MSLTVAYEGDTDLPVIKKLAADARLEISAPIDCQGKHYLDAQLPRWNDAAQRTPWFVLRDLDRDAACAGAFVRGAKVQPSPWMCFRIAVRAIESWLMADAEAFSEYFHVGIERLPVAPDGELDPTQTLLNVVRSSRKPSIRNDVLPRPGRSSKVGQLYESRIIEFGEIHWDVKRATKRSPSLARARDRLRELAARWHHANPDG